MGVFDQYAAPATQPGELALGHTPPAPDPGATRPRTNQIPLGQSGRANFYGLPTPDEINRELIGQNGLRTFDVMYRTDPDIRRLVLMAFSPIVSGTWNLEPHGGDDATDQDRQIAETIWWALTKHMSPNFLEHLNTMGPVLLRSGFCPFEQIWDTTIHDGKTLLLPRKLDLRLPRSVWQWWQDDYGELTHIGQILPNKPRVIIPASELVYYRLAAEGDNWVGTSLLRHAYKSWMLKDRLERIDAIGQERKAVGVPVVYPPEQADDQVRGEVEQVLANLHTNEVGYIIAPGPHAQDLKDMPGAQGWRFDVITFDSSSSSGIQESLKYHREGIASSFLGDFMQLGHHAVGARATAEVQEDPFLTAVDALSSMIIPPLDRLVERIVELNWASATGAPTFTLSLHDSTSLSELQTFVSGLVASGAMQVDPELEDFLRDQADLPPANADIRQQKQDAQQAGFDAAKEAPAAPDPANPAAPTGQQPAGQNVKQPVPTPAAPGVKPQAPPTATGKQLEQPPTVKWWESLLSQDRLREALDGARDHIEQSCSQPVLTVARQMAYQASNGATVDGTPPAALVDSLTQHYESMYHLGAETVTAELHKQRQALRTLAADDNIAAGAVAGSRLRRARQRGEHSARNIVNRISERLGRDQITALKDPQALTTGAEQTATGQLRVEALANTAVSINDGRADTATLSSDVIGGYYTSVLDDRSCDPCVIADDGNLLSVDEATALSPPNPLCAGQDYCRCMMIWVLSSDPAALQSVL